MAQDYNANSIEQLTFRQGCRKRIGIYLGSADRTGVLAGLLELVNNATDEALVCPTATKIELEIGEDWASCRDYGRGMPHGKNSFTNEVMINLLTENHSGAKFNDNAYGGKSRGLNGTGSAATCCSSDWFEISSYRDGAEWFMRFEEGIPCYSECIRKETTEKQGTFIKYKPSQEVFSAEPICFDYDDICSKMKEYSYFNKGIKFVVKNSATGEVREFISNNGLLDFAKDHIQDPIHKTPLHVVAKENDIDVELIFQWTTGREKFYLFSNGGENPDGGTPITGIRTSLTNFFKKYLKECNPDIVRSGLVCICSVNLKNPIYDGQTKTKITNPELRGLCQRYANQILNEFAETADFKKVVEVLTKVNKAEIAAENIKKSILKGNKEVESTIKKKVFSSQKLKDARKLGKGSTLYICEGSSAVGALSHGRDPAHDGLLEIRGKIINCLSNPMDKVMANEEVLLILSALGVTTNNYKASKLRYEKVAIATDADKDGNHIALLLLSFFSELLPDMLKEGRIYRLEAPTHIVHTPKQDYYFYGQEDFNNKTVSGQLTMCKGLGEMSPNQVKDSLFGKNQRLVQFNWTSETDKVLRQLMGDDGSYRKDFLFNKVDFSTVVE